MAVEIGSLTNGQKVAGVAAGATVLGAFLPWVDAGIVTVDGLSGDGVFTLVFGIVVIAVVLANRWGRKATIGTAILGVLTVLIALVTYGNLENQTEETIIEATAGGGLHLTLLGGIGMAAAGVYGLVAERGRSDPEPAEARQPRQPADRRRDQPERQRRDQPEGQRRDQPEGQRRDQPERQRGRSAQQGGPRDQQPREDHRRDQSPRQDSQQRDQPPREDPWGEQSPQQDDRRRNQQPRGDDSRGDRSLRPDGQRETDDESEGWLD